MSTDIKRFDASTFNFPLSTLLNFTWFLAALLAFQGWSSQALAAEPTPTKQDSEAAPAFKTVQQWWNDQHPEPSHDPTKTTDPLERAERINLISEDPIIKVRLLDRTKAFLFPVYIDPRGRNDWIHLVLVRPKLQDVQEVPSPVGRSAKVYDLDGDGVSEIVVEDLGSGQGTTSGEQAIVHLDGPQPIILHYASFFENEGEWGKQDHRYYSRQPTWKFVDLNGDGIRDLLEVVTIEQGRDGRDPKIIHIRNKYLFKNGTFVQSDTAQMDVTTLRKKLQAAAVRTNIYSIDGDPLPETSGAVLDRVSGYWRIRDYDSGKFKTVGIFASEAEACSYFFNKAIQFYVSWNNKKYWNSIN